MYEALKWRSSGNAYTARRTEYRSPILLFLHAKENA